MPTHNRVLVIGALAVIVLAGIGAAVQLLPWLREHRTEISLLLLMLLLVGSGFTVAVALITTLAAQAETGDTETEGDGDPTESVGPVGRDREWRAPEPVTGTQNDRPSDSRPVERNI